MDSVFRAPFKPCCKVVRHRFGQNLGCYPWPAWGRPEARAQNPKAAQKLPKSPFETANRWIQFSVRRLNPAAKFCVIGLDKILALQCVGLTCYLGQPGAGRRPEAKIPRPPKKVAKSPVDIANWWAQISVRGLNPAAELCVIGSDKIRTLQRVGLTCTLTGLGPARRSEAEIPRPPKSCQVTV